MRHCASRVGLCKLRMSSTSVLGSSPGFAVLCMDLIRLAIWGTSALTDCLAVDPGLNASEAMLVTHKERVTTLESRTASKDTELEAKTTQLLKLEGRVKMADGGVSLMSASICELKAKLADAEEARTTATGAFRSAMAWLETVNASEM